MNCLLKGWSGDESNVLICLWRALPAALRDKDSGPYAEEQKLDMRVKKKGNVADSREAAAGQAGEKIKSRPIFQGKVRFDWSAAKAAPIENMTESWWRQCKDEFPSLRSQLEKLCVGEQANYCFII